MILAAVSLLMAPPVAGAPEYHSPAADALDRAGGAYEQCLHDTILQELMDSVQAGHEHEIFSIRPEVLFDRFVAQAAPHCAEARDGVKSASIALEVELHPERRAGDTSQTDEADLDRLVVAAVADVRQRVLPILSTFYRGEQDAPHR